MFLIFQNHFSRLKPARDKTMGSLDKQASTLEKSTKGTDIANLARSVAGLAAGILMLVGVVLIPVSFAAFVGLTTVAVIVAVAEGSIFK